MLEDRDYMREPGSRLGAMSLTKLLTIVMVVVFALQCINDVYLHTDAESYLALTSEGLRHGWVWQLITFQFLHGNVTHILGNLLSFWWLGRFTENVLGRKRFLVALFGCGVVGGLLQGALMLLFPHLFGQMAVGASAGVSGLLAIFALLESDTEIRLNFIFPIRGIALLWLWGGLSLFFTLVPSIRGGSIAYASHLGGILAGIAWVKLGWHHDYVQLPWERAWAWLQSRRTSRPAKAKSQARAWEPTVSSHIESDNFADNSKDEVDAILDKISAKGIQSLNAREHAILESARKRMSQK